MALGIYNGVFPPNGLRLELLLKWKHCYGDYSCGDCLFLIFIYFEIVYG